MSKPYTLRMTVDVTYDGPRSEMTHLKTNLHAIMANAYREGQFTEDLKSFVETFEVDVEEIDPTR